MSDLSIRSVIFTNNMKVTRWSLEQASNLVDAMEDLDELSDASLTHEQYVAMCEMMQGLDLALAGRDRYLAALRAEPEVETVPCTGDVGPDGEVDPRFAVHGPDGT